MRKHSCRAPIVIAKKRIIVKVVMKLFEGVEKLSIDGDEKLSIDGDEKL